MADKILTFSKVDLNGNSRRVVPCLGYSTATFQFVPTTSVSTVVWTIKRSNDGINWVALDDSQLPASASKTLGPAAGITTTIAIDTAYLCAEITTPEVATDFGDIIACLKE